MKKLIIKWAIKQLVNLYHREPSYGMLYEVGVEDMFLDAKKKEMTIIVMDR